ncbi:GDP-6-deoxy-D-mannose reductase [Firmicutes bacterium ASF500]|nr:GDP-6-deoxy-D-mannose reductase [Firmicutes bacterium ASF500]USF26373.1 GDP-6-deoxy-D-mannose reductase [Firmicutes bacterium ASF500]
MKKVVITGAGGFIGRNLTRRLLEENIQVYAIDVEAAQKNILTQDGVIPLYVDIREKQQLTAILKVAQPDVFYHLAWAGVSTDVKNEIEMQISNIPLAISVLEACAEAGCEHIIIPGSASEYAYCGQTIDGGNIPAPGDAYAASKAAAQVLCQWYARERRLNLNWLLIGSIYGPGRNDSNILTYTIKALLHGEETKYSKLEQMWDYIYIDDLAEALYLLGLYGKPDGVYPLGSGRAKPLAEYIRKIQAEIAPDAFLGIGSLPYKCGSKPDNSVLDIRRLREDTGFVPQITFEEGISRTIRYFREMEQAK